MRPGLTYELIMFSAPVVEDFLTLYLREHSGLIHINSATKAVSTTPRSLTYSGEEIKEQLQQHRRRQVHVDNEDDDQRYVIFNNHAGPIDASFSPKVFVPFQTEKEHK